MIEQLRAQGGRARPQDGDRRRAARDRARRGRDQRADPAQAVRDRRAAGLPADAARRGAAGDDRAGRRRARASCTRNGVRVVPRGAGTSLSGGALPMADSVVVGLMRMNRILDIDYADRCATGAGGGDQYRHHPGGRGRGVLLRARSVEPARLHDRRQCRDELGRRALPEIRRDGEQPARAADRDDRGRGHRYRRRASGRGRATTGSAC